MVCFVLAGLGNGLFDPALSAHLLDITPPEHTARLMGIKATAGSFGNLLGPALVVLFVSFASPQVIFLAAGSLIILLTIASAFVLRARPAKAPAPSLSDAPVPQ